MNIPQVPIHWVWCMALIACPYSIQAQSWLYPESILSYNPLADNRRNAGSAFLGSMLLWGEAGQYTALRDENHRWNVTLGGTAELYGEATWNILFETNMHLVVDPNNNLSFNPRAFIWEEGLFAGFAHDVHTIYIGYAHRCKHDVDNYELLQTTGRTESRALIYGSGAVRWYREPYGCDGFSVAPLAEAHVYLLVQDQRFPVATRTAAPNLEALQGALRLRVDAEVPLCGNMALGFTGDVRVTALGESPVNRFGRVQQVWVEPALEAAVGFKGTGGVLQIFGRYAYQEDDFITPVPRSAELFCVGVRLKR